MDRNFRRPQVFVVAPRHLDIEVRGAHGCEVVVYDTIDDLVRWREGLPPQHPTIRECVTTALRESGCGELDPRLAVLFGWLGQQSTTPHLKELINRWTSQRSFFRTWAAFMPEPPSRFLMRIRTAHARLLLQDGASKSVAMKIAGFRSVSEMNRCVSGSNSVEFGSGF